MCHRNHRGIDVVSIIASAGRGLLWANRVNSKAGVECQTVEPIAAGPARTQTIPLPGLVLRDLIIPGHPMYTHCANFSHSRRDNKKIRGPVFSTGLGPGYVRLPWLGTNAPESHRRVKCNDCGDHIESGIEIHLKTGEKFGFCCNRNYLSWWMSRTPEPRNGLPTSAGFRAARRIAASR